MNAKGSAFFDELLGYHTTKSGIGEKYQQFRFLLERVCKDLTAGEHIQFSNLFSRLNYICTGTAMPAGNIFRINTLRVRCTSVLYNGLIPSQEDYRDDLKAFCEALAHFYHLSVPEELKREFPAGRYAGVQPRERRLHERVRISVAGKDDQYIHGYDEEHPTEQAIRIRHDSPGLKEFAPTVERLWKGCQINLLDVAIDENGDYLPAMIILEPDYLVDISSLAECMKEYGRHPLHYIQHKFEPMRNTRHILLGAAANAFLDEFVNEREEAPVDYSNAMRKVFRSAPFEFSTCSDLSDREAEVQFFKDARVQFQNIQRVVNQVFKEQKIDREKAVIEPSFLCEQLGIQGRLDFLQADGNGDGVVIELKSGKAPFPETNYTLTALNHQSQAYLYQILLQRVMRFPPGSRLQTFIFYSKYTHPSANLRFRKPVLSEIREILNIRNLIVANESSIAMDGSELSVRKIIDNISPAELITGNKVHAGFLEKYIIPSIDHFRRNFQEADPLEQAYFFSFYSFVTREQYLAKAGDVEYDSKKGTSSLWNTSLSEKQESGEILPDLSIVENRADIDATILFGIPVRDEDYLPNFRQGDIVILYERNGPEDNVTNKQVFKGAIEFLSPDRIKVRIRYRQRNQAALPLESRYAIEHDFLDSAHNALYRGLFSFLQASPARKDWLLGRRRPAVDTSVRLLTAVEPADMREVVWKAKAARELFLLLGPPGTGKTSRALRSMVEEFYADSSTNILLVSYTNRAVDEICSALDKVKGQPFYIRIGSELSCQQEHRGKLLDIVMRDCDNRQQVRDRIGSCRIFVGTVASVSNRPELFKLKHFQVAIVDEASQILEPALLGLLSARNAMGEDAVDRFILIGDHKQLPAIVLQSEEAARVKDPGLISIGLSDRRRSLFERLYRQYGQEADSPVWSILDKQGRMHPAIADFPSRWFYGGKLGSAGAPHQLAELEYERATPGSRVDELIVSCRMAFVPSAVHAEDKTHKTNLYEAKIVALLVQRIYFLHQLSGLSFSAERTLGIITPYRSQIALIKREIHGLGVPMLNDITVDTVERFQGSERDIILYSFSVNRLYQLDFLVSETEEAGEAVDRKLNVALTRARKQLFITGNPAILQKNRLYRELIESIRAGGGFVDMPAEEFLRQHESNTDKTNQS